MREKPDTQPPLDDAKKEARVLRYEAERIAEENFHPPTITTEVYAAAEDALNRLSRKWPGDFRSYVEAQNILLDIQKVKPRRKDWYPAPDRQIRYVAQIILKEAISVIQKDLGEDKKNTLPTPSIVMKQLRSRLKKSRVHYELEYLYPGSAEFFEKYAVIVTQVVLEKFKKKTQRK